VEADSIRFKFAGDLQAQHELLRQLVDHGLPIAEFAVAQSTLQDSYLALMRAEAKQ
jgi:hypothetical protein